MKNAHLRFLMFSSTCGYFSLSPFTLSYFSSRTVFFFQCHFVFIPRSSDLKPECILRILSSYFCRRSTGGTRSSRAPSSSDWETDSEEVTYVPGCLCWSCYDVGLVVLARLFPLVVGAIGVWVFFGSIPANNSEVSIRQNIHKRS